MSRTMHAQKSICKRAARNSEAPQLAREPRATLGAEPLLKQFREALVAFEVRDPSEAGLMVVALHCGTARVPFEIDERALQLLPDETVAALAGFLANAACALSLVPSITAGQHFRAVTPLIQSLPYEGPGPLAGFGLFYDESLDTAFFFNMREWAGVSAEDIADEIKHRKANKWVRPPRLP